MKNMTKRQRKDPKCGFGYAIFQEKDEQGILITSNIPHKKFQKGEDFWKALKLPIAEQRMIRSACASSGVYLIFSSLGVGFLSTQYEMWAGYRIYVHLHEDPLVLKNTLGRMKHTLLLWQDVLSREASDEQPTEAEEPDFDADLALILVDTEKMMTDAYLPCEDRAEKGIKIPEFVEMVSKLLDCKVNVDYRNENEDLRSYHTLYPGLHRSLILILLSLLRESFGTCPVDMKITEDKNGGYQMSMKLFACLNEGKIQEDAVELFLRNSGRVLRRYIMFSAKIGYQTKDLTDVEAEKLMREYKNPDHYCVFEVNVELPRDPSATPPGMMKARPLLISDDEN